MRAPAVSRRVLASTLLLSGLISCHRNPETAQAGEPAPVMPIPPPLAPTENLCEGLVADLNPHPLTALSKPRPGQTVVDPQFRTKIHRISAAAPSEGANAVIKPMYGTIQAWNADESRLLLWHRERGHELYDGRSYEFLRSLRLVSPTDIEHLLWDPVDPDVFYYPSNYNATPNLMRYRVSTDKSDVLRRFEGCPVGDWGRLLSLGTDPMYLSWGAIERVIGLSCGESKFLYDVVTDNVLGQGNAPGRVAPQPGPSGRLAYYDGRVYDALFRPLRTLRLANPYEHASLGRSAKTGHDHYNAVIFDPPSGGSSAAEVGTLVTFDMETGERRVIVGPSTGFPYPPAGTHISAIAHKRPGWVAVSVVGAPRGQTLLDGELLLANIDTGAVCRVAHHRSYAGEGRWGYFGEPHVVVSPSATRLLFGSDWGNGDTVDTYVVELPSYEAR